MKALHQGKHVIVEKPIALNPQDAREMFALAREKGVRLFVAQVLRFTRESAVLRRLVETEEYGKVLDASFSRLSACPRWVKNGWLFDKAKSGLLPFDLHIHDLDLIVSLFGRPKDFSFTSCGNRDKSYKEHYRFNYNYGDFNVCAQAAWYNADFPFTATWQVYFEKAVVKNDEHGVIAYQFDREPLKFDTEEKIKIPTGINVPPTEIYLTELSHFIKCLREDRDSDMISEEQIIAVMEILSSISEGE
jgi:UDP-N-acetylglucosamine 3-dehydrogenase